MPNRILVTYVSRTGSTAEVAEAIARTLTESGANVGVISMNDVKDLSQYQAVVAGMPSAVRNGSPTQHNSSRLIGPH
jgi:menaquinone-dependent protoporphyrinogen oxidase